MFILFSLLRLIPVTNANLLQEEFDAVLPTFHKFVVAGSQVSFAKEGTKGAADPE